MDKEITSLQGTPLGNECVVNHPHISAERPLWRDPGAPLFGGALEVDERDTNPLLPIGQGALAKAPISLEAGIIDNQKLDAAV